MELSRRRLYFFFFFLHRRFSCLAQTSVKKSCPEADLWIRKSLSIFRGLMFEISRLRAIACTNGEIFLDQGGRDLREKRLSRLPLPRKIRIKFFYYLAWRFVRNDR